MKVYKKKLLLSALAWAVMLTLIHAPNAESAPSKLTGTLQAEVKSLTAERIEQGSRIAAVVRLFNQGAEMVRVPDYDVRAITTDNVSYTLQPSAENPAAILPHETVEMRYMLTVRRTGTFIISKLAWVQMNKSVYPFTEKTVLTLPATQNRMESKPWGQPFSLPSAPAHMVFTPVKLFEQMFLEGPNLLISFQAENKGAYRDFVPDFLVEGKTEKKLYAASKFTGSKTMLEPGEKSIIHYRIQLDGKEKLESLNILTRESFVEAGQKITLFHIGWLRIFVPASLNESPGLDQLPAYDGGIPIALDPDNRLIPREVEISLAELTVESGFNSDLKTAVAGFTVVNRGFTPLPKPEFAVELMSPGGRQYLGTVMSPEKLEFGFKTEPNMEAVEVINPNVPYTITYEFQLPSSEIGGRMGVILSDNKSLQPFRIPIAAFRATVQ